MISRAGSAIAVAALGVVYQFWFKHLLFNVFGVGRVVEPIENFPFSCRRIVSPQLEACEHLWLDHGGRVLYAACAGSESRGNWNPPMSKYNVSGRRPQGSELMRCYVGAAGDETMDFLGFDAEEISPSTIRFWMINQRPPVNSKKELLDAAMHGANTTVDVFEYTKGKKKMELLKTVVDDNIYSGNSLALVGDGSFVLTNDHSVKVGLRKKIALLLGGGNVAYCNSAVQCHPATSKGLNFPNGVARGASGLIYVGFTGGAFIGVYRLEHSGKMTEVNRIEIGMPLDNLSVDSNGDIWAAGTPRAVEVMGAVDDPLNKAAASTVWKIHPTKNGSHVIKKVLEDVQAKPISLATTPVHDARSGRIFIGSVTMPYLVVCDPR